MSKKILITGYYEFIGIHLVEQCISRGFRLRGLSRQGTSTASPEILEIFRGDLTRPDTLQGIADGIDTIIHAAGCAHSVTVPGDLHQRITVDGTRALLAKAEAARKGLKHIFLFIRSAITFFNLHDWKLW